jgi:5'(3')-deoxyribonucleotidase
MRIAIDFDDTIILQYAEVIKILNKRHGLNIDYNEVSYWNYTQDNYEEVTLEEILDIVYHFKPYDCKPVDKHIANYFNKITKKHDVDIVTARWGNDRLYMDIQYTLYLLGLRDYKDIILSKNNHKQDMGYDLIVDDSPNLPKALLEDWFGGAIMFELPTVIVYDQPWNWSIECEKYPFLHRAKDWKQVYNIVKSYE